MATTETGMPARAVSQDLTTHAVLTDIRRLLVLMRPFWGSLAQGAGASVMIGLLSLSVPIIGKTVIDEVYPSRDTSLLAALMIATLVVTISTPTMTSIRAYYAQIVTSRLSATFILALFTHVQKLPLSFFEERRVGEVTSRFGEAKLSIQTLSSALQTIVLSGSYFVLIPPILILMHWRLALIALIAIPLNIAITALTGPTLRHRWRDASSSTADVNAFQTEALSHPLAVKALGLERYCRETLKELFVRNTRAGLAANRWSISVGLVTNVIRAAGLAAFTWLAWHAILRGELTLGAFIAFSSFLGMLTGPATQLTGVVNSLQQAAVSLHRAFEYADVPVEAGHHRGVARASHRNELSQEISLLEVTLRYPGGTTALRCISTKCIRGRVTAIAGPSGAGKSSILKLIVGLATPTSGRVTLGRLSVSDLPPDRLRRHIASVWHDASMFRGTIRDNLTIGLDAVDDGVVTDALRVSQLDSVLAQLPDGINTNVAEGGVSLSGGQRQRVAIARALIRQPQVLLLDEATSQLDASTEDIVLRGLLTAMTGRTVVMITHRASTLCLADQILVVNEGQLLAVGSHENLLRTCPFYSAFQGLGGPMVKQLSHA